MMRDENELYYEKQMDIYYQSIVDTLKENMSDKDLGIILPQLDFYFRYKVEGVKIRMVLLKVLYDYEPPLHIDFKEVLKSIQNPDKKFAFRVELDKNNVGKKSTFDLLNEYINKKEKTNG